MTVATQESQQVVINPSAAVPLALMALGVVILLFAALVNVSTAFSMSMVLVGAGVLLAGATIVPPSPIFLVAMNAVCAIYLLLQGLGLCQSHCGGFIDYRTLLGLPTVFVGFGLHVALTGLGLLRFQRRLFPVELYRAAVAIGQGASLYFVVIMAAHQHWCPSCAAAHAAILAQACLLWRLTPEIRSKATWGLTVLVSALSVNAIFHHAFERPDLAPGEQLLGWMLRASDTQQTGVAISKTAATTASPMAARQPTATAETAKGKPRTLSPEAQSAFEAALPKRRQDFFRWGDVTAPITVRAHMSVVCHGCRDHWPNLDKIRPLVNSRKIQVEFDFTWPIKPNTHYGAQLATYVLYNAGLHGEDEMLAVADKLFSADGFQLIDKIGTVLEAESVKGEIPTDSKKDALVELFRFCDDALPAKQAIDTYTKYKQDIDNHITKSISWLAQYGDLATPHYYFLRTGDTDAKSVVDVNELDADVWDYCVAKTLKGAPAAEARPISSAPAPVGQTTPLPESK